MRVRAVQRGYYLWMRQAGEEFVIPDHLAALVNSPQGGWQESLEDPAPAVSAPAPEPDFAPAPKPAYPRAPKVTK